MSNIRYSQRTYDEQRGAIPVAIHRSHFHRRAYWLYRSGKYGPMGYSKTLYTLGFRKPNYPMPAIPNETDIMPTYVVRFEWHGPKQHGEYCVVSKLWDKPITQN